MKKLPQRDSWLVSRRRRPRLCGPFLGFTLGLSLLANQLVAASSELDFLTGLAERGLFRLAEIQGQALWNEGNPDARQRAELAVQLARIFALQASALPRSQRASAWEKAELVLDQYLDRHPDAPQVMLIHVQRAWIHIARGRLERTETQGTQLEQAGLVAAREHLRTGIQQLQGTVEMVEEQLRLPSRPADGFSEDELLNLRRNLDLELGRAYCVQAVCYPPDSADRDNAFLLALEHFDPLVNRTASEPVVWQARLEALRAHRELGRYDEAGTLWRKWQQEPPPRDFIIELTAEFVRLELARGEVDAALEMAGSHRDERAMQLVYLEALIARWREAKDQEPARADQWARRITAKLDRIRHNADPQHVREAERLVGRALVDSASDQPADALKLAAETLYYAGNWGEAVAAYDRAGDQLRKESKHHEAFELGLIAAAIEHEAGRFAAASERYCELARNTQQSPARWRRAGPPAGDRQRCRVAADRIAK
jgi:tetratricopeptide (TPR) repeat protein